MEPPIRKGGLGYDIYMETIPDQNILRCGTDRDPKLGLITIEDKEMNKPEDFVQQIYYEGWYCGAENFRRLYRGELSMGEVESWNSSVAKNQATNLTALQKENDRLREALEKSKRLYFLGLNESTHYHLNDEVLAKKCCDEAGEILRVIRQALNPPAEGGKEGRLDWCPECAEEFDDIRNNGGMNDR